MSLTASEFAALKALVDEEDHHREVECQPYIVHAAGLLIPGTPTRIVREDRNFFGSTDFVVAADIRGDLNQTARCAYIWELKAPQCHLFEADTHNRCRPSAAFLQAENQLLHYYHEASGNSRFRERMSVVDEDNIYMGGLVIGTNARMFRGSTEIEKAEMALRVRKKYFYHSHKIRILTWDDVLDFLRPSPHRDSENRSCVEGAR